MVTQFAILPFGWCLLLLVLFTTTKTTAFSARSQPSIAKQTHWIASPPSSSSSSLYYATTTVTAIRTSRLAATPPQGFGEKEDKKVTTSKSVGAQQRDRGSQRYDEIAALGGQEYRIFVRQFGASDDTDDNKKNQNGWLPCGLIAVPRGSQVPDAIQSTVLELQKAIVRTYPKLKGMELEFEYGYNLKIYPDDPIEVANMKNSQAGGSSGGGGMFSFGNWMKTLLSPVDTSMVQQRPPTND
jgi:hypothetical protein